jgi:hypothetical protein
MYTYAQGSNLGLVLTNRQRVRFEVLKAITIVITVVWNVTPCSLLDIY